MMHTMPKSIMKGGDGCGLRHVNWDWLKIHVKALGTKSSKMQRNVTLNVARAHAYVSDLVSFMRTCMIMSVTQAASNAFQIAE